MINRFLEEVCNHISYKKIHSEIKKELYSHLTEMIECRVEEGLSEEEATKESIAEMGSPKEIGKQFQSVYKPKINWFWVAAIVFIGLSSLLSIFVISKTDSFENGTVYLEKQMFYLLIGFVVMFLFATIDLEKIKKYSYHLYFISVGIMYSVGIYLYVIKDVGIQDAISYYYRLGYHYLMIPLILGLIGIFEKNNSKDNNDFYIKMVFFIVFPLSSALLLPQKLSFIGEYILISLLLFSFCDISRLKKVIIGISMFSFTTFLIVLSVFIEPYRLKRLSLTFNPYQEPNGAGYHQVRSLEMLKNSRLFGRGNEINYEGVLPERYTDAIFPHITYEIGYGFSILILFILGLLFINIAKRIKQNSVSYLQMVGFGSLLLIVSPVIVNVLMHFSLFPIQAGVYIPFLSYAGYSTLFYFIAIGLILNIERKKQYYKIVLAK